MPKYTFVSLLLLVCACSDQHGGQRPAEPAGSGAAPSANTPAASSDPREGVTSVPAVVPTQPAGPPQAAILEGLVVHEWGTFTSVGSSTGVLMEGLHHEEEALPAFVHGRSVEAGIPVEVEIPTSKAMEVVPMQVTQKLETPVLYFYGAAARNVRVRVDFPDGVLSQWYPAATRFGPELGLVAVPRQGFMEWEFDMMPGMSATEFPAVAPDNIWAPSRRVRSVPVAVGAEREGFIFYRGLGAFELPLRMTVDAADQITIRNLSTDVSPAVFLLRVHPGGGAIVELGSLAAGGVMANVPSPIGGKERNLDVYVAEAQNLIAAALVKTGLYADEARAMVDTWSKSYFKSEGLRVLYVVPRAWTDKLLPLSVQPAPKDVVRTLVGRVELLAPSEEKDLLARVSTAAARGMPFPEVVSGMGRLAEPKLRRALELNRS